MAKLTEEQKAKNKAERKVRDAAFRERYKSYHAERDAIKNLAESLPEHDTWMKARAEIEALVDARNEQEKALRLKIEALREAHHQEELAFAKKIEEVRLVRDTADKTKRAFVNERLDAVDARYPDMVGRYSAAGWTPPSNT